MVMLDASRRNQRVPRLALWSLGAGIVATVGASLAHGLGHGPIGALVSAWPALALVGSPELFMLLVRTASGGGHVRRLSDDSERAGRTDHQRAGSCHIPGRHRQVAQAHTAWSAGHEAVKQ
jgi:hypothetical protein